MDRRDFNKVMGAAVAGMLVGSKAFGQEEKAEEKEAKHVCKGNNDCKGHGGCRTEHNGCAGKNDCKGKGGCATTAQLHDCAGKNDCKGQGGCGGKEGKNDCKGQGGCEVPLKPEHQNEK